MNRLRLIIMSMQRKDVCRVIELYIQLLLSSANIARLVLCQNYHSIYKNRSYYHNESLDKELQVSTHTYSWVYYIYKIVYLLGIRKHTLPYKYSNYYKNFSVRVNSAMYVKFTLNLVNSFTYKDIGNYVNFDTVMGIKPMQLLCQLGVKTWNF